MQLNDRDLEYLEDKYFLVKRKRIYAMLGGALAFIIASGILSYVAALQTIQGKAGQQSLSIIKENADQARSIVESMKWINYPIGTIIAYSGDSSTIDFDAWRLCDGAEIDRNEYAALFDVIGTSWGAGDGERTFALPDFRGMFLRGADYGAEKDPDVADRFNGRNLPGEVGSYQDDAFQGHEHFLRSTPNNGRSGNNTTNYGVGAKVGERSGTGAPTLMEGFGEVRFSSETRPNNAYVNWLVKVR
ncbi:MAG: phage tail protein [Bacteroidota bacterium]